MVTSASQSTLIKRNFWITDAALSNWREKVKNFPTMGDERLSLAIDEQVSKAIGGGKVEYIVDGDEPARLVHLTDGDDPYFALVKKSTNPANGEYAVVTIMTPAQVDKKRQTQWSRPGFGLTPESKTKLATIKPSDPPPPAVSGTKTPQNLPERQPVGGEKPNTFLLSYMPFKAIGEHTPRVYEEYGTEAEVERRIEEVKITPGTLRVYKQLAIGYRIING